MDITSFQTANLSSIKQALNIAVLRNSMNQNASTVETLVNDMQAANTKLLEQSLTPYKGNHIDIRI